MNIDKYAPVSLGETSNFKHYFLAHDCMEFTYQQVTFSAFSNYVCKAGCKFCYLEPIWSTPPSNTLDYFADADTVGILRFFKWFGNVNTIDDLLLIQQYPHIEKFYHQYAHLMNYSSATDVALIQQYDILMSGRYKFKSIYEITFSDWLLEKPAAFKSVLSKLTNLSQSFHIIKLKVIVTQGGSEVGANVRALAEWANAQGIPIGLHGDILSGFNDAKDLTHADYHESNHIHVNGQPIHTISESVFLCGTQLYLTLSDATSEECTPYMTVDNNTHPVHFVQESIKHKVYKYAWYAGQITQTCDSKTRDYYRYVSQYVTPNPEPTFIPILMLPQWQPLYAAIEESGWVSTPHGLVKLGATDIVPLITVQNQPKRLLRHIPIKCISK